MQDVSESGVQDGLDERILGSNGKLVYPIAVITHAV